MDRLNECEIVTPTRRWTLNYYITQCTGNSISWGSDELEIRCGRENQHPERLGPQAPGWATQENGKETQLWPIEWGSICCSSVWSPTTSHTQPFQIKWEVYFSRELCCSSLLCRRYDFVCICIWVYNNCIIETSEGTCGILVIVVGNGYGNPSSNPRQGGLHFS